ncbi:MAG: CBS domain-containing protein [Chloroflexi bacterium]|nr:CBS domain-containing protein [Chloroflexota bacterium]
MQIKDLMTRDVEVADYDITLQEAASKMKNLNVGVLPVRQATHIVGMLTDRDIVTRAVAEGWEPTQTLVAEIMTVGLVYCYEDETVEEAAKVMAEQQVRRLPVFTREQRLVGIVSLGDLVEDMADDALFRPALRAERQDEASPLQSNRKFSPLRV